MRLSIVTSAVLALCLTATVCKSQVLVSVTVAPPPSSQSHTGRNIAIVSAAAVTGAVVVYLIKHHHHARAKAVGHVEQFPTGRKPMDEKDKKTVARLPGNSGEPSPPAVK